MTNRKLIRAWKDVEFRESLSEVERQQLGCNPAGGIELSEKVLKEVAGGAHDPCSFPCVEEDDCNDDN